MGSSTLEREEVGAVGRRLAPYLLLLVVSLVVHWSYLVEPGRPFFVDSNLPLSYDDFATTYFHTWNANEGHFNFAQFMRIPYVLPLYATARALGVGVDAFVTFLFWLPTYLGMTSGFVFFTRTLGGRRRSLGDQQRDPSDGGRLDRRLVAVGIALGVFYGLNPWITKHFAQYYFRVSHAFLPLALLFLLEYVRGGRRRHLVLAAGFGVLVAMNPHFLVYFFLLAGLFAVVDGTLSKELLTRSARTTHVAGLFVLLSLFWLLPFLYVSARGGNVVGYNVGREIVSLYSMRNRPVNLLTFTGGYWPGITERPWWLFEPLRRYQAVFLAIPIAAFSGFLTARRDDRFALFCGVAVLLTLALATGYKYGPPVTTAYDVVLQLPFHGVLRAPERLLAMLPLLYGYLIGVAVLDGDPRPVRWGAAALLVVVCLALVLTNVHVFSTALAPTVLPDDHARVETADYEDVFVVPPRHLGGYNPKWMFSREGGIVDSYDTHLYASPDTRQHYLNYYVLELIDQGHTDAAVGVLRKTGANHVLVRRDTVDRGGVPPSEATVAELDGALDRAYTGEHLVVYDVDASRERFRIVRPVPVRRDVDAARPLADDPDVFPYFRSQEGTDPLLAALGGTRRFHPSNAFQLLNQMDRLSRPPTHAGYVVHGERRLAPPESDGSLVVRAIPLSHGAEIVRETETGREVWKLPEGHEHTRIDLEGEGRPLTIRGPVYVERLYVTEDDVEGAPEVVAAPFHGGGTVTPNQTELSVEGTGSSVDVRYFVPPEGGFLQVSFTPDSPVDGPLTVRTSVESQTGGDDLGVVLLTESGDVEFYGSRERLRPGEQNVTFHLPDVPSDVRRIQLAVLPRDRPTRNRLTVRDLDLVARPDATRPAPGRPECESRPTRPRCEGAAEVTAVEQRGPGRYELSVDASAPYALHFGEAYDPLWVAEVTGPNGTRRYTARPLYGATNGFLINETGGHAVTVRYRPQRWFVVGSTISGAAMVACGAYLLAGWRRRRVNALVPWRPHAVDRVTRRIKRRWRETSRTLRERIRSHVR